MKVIRKNYLEIDSEEKKEIDKFIENNYGLIFHEIKFNHIISETFNTGLSYFIAYNKESNIAGICPLHTIKSGLLRLAYSNSSKFEIPFGGWVFDKMQISIKQLMKQTNIKYNESLSYNSNIQIKEDVYKNNFVNAAHLETAVVDLSLDLDDIWKSVISPKKRNKIRKAIKSEIEIKQYGPEGVELYYPLMIDMRNKISSTAKPKVYYKNILDNYFSGNQGIILLAEKNDEIISGVILIGNKYVMHYWQGASKKDVPNLGQGELLQWEAIKWSKKNASRYYDLCVINKEKLPHIARFKLDFSKNVVPFYHISKRPLSFRILSKIQKTFM